MRSHGLKKSEDASLATANLRPLRNDREHLEQKALMEWVGLRRRAHPDLDLLYAIPNGGHRNRRTAGRLKAEGVRSGVPDLCLPVARGGAHGLYIEMKAPGGRESDTQRWWRERLLAEGYWAVVCVGAESAIAALNSYLAEPRTVVVAPALAAL